MSALRHLFRDGEPGSPVLLTLHGTGSDETDIAGLGSMLHPGAAVLSPRGSVSEHGMLRWFRRLSEGVFDVDDVEQRSDELASFVGWARAEYDITDRVLIAVGLSNGANIALATALRHPSVIDRVVAFSGMYPFGDRSVDAELSGSEILLLNGQIDPMAPAASVDRLEQVLRSSGADVQRVTRAGGHGIDRTDVDAAREWVAARST